MPILFHNAQIINGKGDIFPNGYIGVEDNCIKAYRSAYLTLQAGGTTVRDMGAKNGVNPGSSQLSYEEMKESIFVKKVL